MRIPIIAGNWKMYKTIPEALQFIETLKPLVQGGAAHAFLAVPFTAITACAEAARKSPIRIGAQNMHDAEEGAFTGEISARMLKDAGATFVLLGHSERRHVFGETNEKIHHKLRRALHSHLTPVLCIGETAQERSENRSDEVIKEQLTSALQGLTANELAPLIIAYEPVWAIGTGLVATPEMAEEAHLFIRRFIAGNWGSELANRLCILYGGSVKPNNIAGLLHQPDIDGALIGGASLDVASFAQMISLGKKS